MKTHFQLAAAKNYFFGFATSGAILFSSLTYFISKDEHEAPTFLNAEFSAAEKISYQDFNPNDLTEEGWRNLGFTENKIATILKYKEVVGGNFTSKAQLKKCYAISAEKFEELESYILLPENGRSNNNSTNQYYNYKKGKNNFSSNYGNYKKRTLAIPGKFNPDDFSAVDFVKMGFTENQANSILKYKNYLGGSFGSKEKFKACFIISEENYRKMEPYLLLPEKSAEHAKASYSTKNDFPEKTKIQYEYFDPNTTDFEGWKKLGFSDKQAQVIINYRDKNLRGSFKTLEDIEKCFVISPAKFQEMKPYLVLNAENIKTNTSYKKESNSSVNQQTENKTDFAKVDLNQITFKQLIEFGFDEKSAAMLLSFRRKLGGFVNRQQVIDTYEIDKNLAQKLVAIANLDNSNVARYTLTDAPEEWLKSHPYFKYSADKIIYFRITTPNDKKIWRSLKTKPEYEARMKLYVKEQ